MIAADVIQSPIRSGQKICLHQADAVGVGVFWRTPDGGGVRSAIAGIWGESGDDDRFQITDGGTAAFIETVMSDDSLVRCGICLPVVVSGDDIAVRIVQIKDRIGQCVLNPCRRERRADRPQYYRNRCAPIVDKTADHHVGARLHIATSRNVSQVGPVRRTLCGDVINFDQTDAVGAGGCRSADNRGVGSGIQDSKDSGFEGIGRRNTSGFDHHFLCAFLHHRV